jgi:hypothetical protein
MDARVHRKGGSLRPTRTVIRPQGCRQRWEGCTHPGLADAHRVSWIRASRRKAGSIGPEGYGHAVPRMPASRDMGGSFGHVRTPMGPHGRAAATGGVYRSRRRRTTMGPDRFKKATGRVHPFACVARPCALIDAPIEPEGRSDPRRRPPASGSSIPASTARLYRSPPRATHFARVSACDPPSLGPNRRRGRS